MPAKRQHKKTVQPLRDADALFLGMGVRAIARKTLPPGFTVADLQQFVELLYGMFDEREAKTIRVFDPFAGEGGRRVTVARLTEALTAIITNQTKKSA